MTPLEQLLGLDQEFEQKAVLSLHTGQNEDRQNLNIFQKSSANLILKPLTDKENSHDNFRSNS